MPDGGTVTVGDGNAPHVTARIKDSATVRHILRRPDIGVGEAYMDGRLTLDNDDLHGFLQLAMMNMRTERAPLWRRPFNMAWFAARRLRQSNRARRAQSNVAHHYDLSGELYDLFLDEDRQYSCAYFADPGMTLEAAQTAKKRHIARKLLIEPDMHVLDIGCGWGGMAITLAQEFGAKVTGITLSQEQLNIATKRVRDAGLDDRVSIQLIDYRALEGSFDRIVSVGMFEHVGLPQFRQYFQSVHDLLDPDGVALIHTIGRQAPPASTSPWIDKYIFPGGYIPSMSEMVAAIEKEGLYNTDIELWRVHYADTLRHWHDRFVANQDKARALYDERFCRMWRFYLVSCEQAFRYGFQCVFQVQMARRQDAVPVTRDYLYRADSGPSRQFAAE